jgi:citrate lyase subunit beta/citryl-CoA lyase
MHPDGIRSLLFVPGDNAKLIGKALSSQADAVILDLEDAVAPEAKVAARTIVREALDSLDRNGKAVFVRVNALETGLALADLSAVVGGLPWGVVLPKCQGNQELLRLSYYLEALETQQDVLPGTVRVLAISTETSGATLNLGSTAPPAPPRLWGSMWGSEDLAASLGAIGNRDGNGNYTFPYQSARSQCLYAASTLGIAAVDSVWTDIRDLDGLEREAREGLRDGFIAKAAIHPAQVDVINRAFTPSAARLEWARRVIDLLADRGVARLDGVMVDLVHKRIAERLLLRAAAISNR